MHIDPQTGLLEQIHQLPSPNCDDRPPGTIIDLIVVHGISLPPGNFGGPWINALFTNTLDTDQHLYFRQLKQLRVSAHSLVRRDGEIVQYVPFHRRAWHAGRSSFRGREECNDYSIGIELEGTDDIPYTGIQYQQLRRLIRALTDIYPAITVDRIVGHADVAPGRKTDPGPAFDWDRLKVSLWSSKDAQ